MTRLIHDKTKFQGICGRCGIEFEHGEAIVVIELPLGASKGYHADCYEKVSEK